LYVENGHRINIELIHICPRKCFPNNLPLVLLPFNYLKKSYTMKYDYKCVSSLLFKGNKENESARIKDNLKKTTRKKI